MRNSIKDWVGKVAQASNDFERNNTDLKRRYFIRNIEAFNYLVSLIGSNRGSFGTGYPFYVLQKDLTGQMPVIDEQIRYNNELLAQAEESKKSNWVCKECLIENYDDMPDLKQVCKPCPNMDNGLKPRKIINRLPDIDMWMICADGHVEEAQGELAKLLREYDIHTSDVNPVQTIQDMEEITEDIKKGVMPKKFLPIDAHIMEYSKMSRLIEQVPLVLARAKAEGHVPYLPIHPKSYRKTWQYDDEAYNFIYDFLSAFTEFNFTSAMSQSLQNTRSKVADEYTTDELYAFLLQSATEPNKRRNQTKALRKAFEDRIGTWRTRKKEGIGEDDAWER